MARENVANDLNELIETPPWEWPRNAGERLMKILRDRGIPALDRTTAAKLAGSGVVMNDKMADALLSLVRSAEEPEELRGAAAIALGPVLEEADTDGFEDDMMEPPISEAMFGRLRESLREIYFDEGVPKLVRRRVLEASVRAPQDWHTEAIRAAMASGDEDWKLTAVFGMRHVRGFDQEILAMLASPNPDVHYEAVTAAATWGLDDAWAHVAGLVTSEATEKPLLLAAIDAVASIRPREAGPLLVDLAESEDEEIAEAASEAMMMARGGLGDFDDEEDDELLR